MSLTGTRKVTKNPTFIFFLPCFFETEFLLECVYLSLTGIEIFIVEDTFKSDISVYLVKRKSKCGDLCSLSKLTFF